MFLKFFEELQLTSIKWAKIAELIYDLLKPMYNIIGGNILNCNIHMPYSLAVYFHLSYLFNQHLRPMQWNVKLLHSAAADAVDNCFLVHACVSTSIIVNLHVNSPPPPAPLCFNP